MAKRLRFGPCPPAVPRYHRRLDWWSFLVPARLPCVDPLLWAHAVQGHPLAPGRFAVQDLAEGELFRGHTSDKGRLRRPARGHGRLNKGRDIA